MSKVGLVNAALVGTLFIRKYRQCEAIYILVIHLKVVHFIKVSFILSMSFESKYADIHCNSLGPKLNIFVTDFEMS